MVLRSRSELVEIIRQYCDTNNLTMYPRRNIYPGDLYVGCRNSGPELLTCHSVSPGGWVNSVEDAYRYDVEECVKVSVGIGNLT